MLEPLDRYRRDSTLFQFTDRRLRDFIDPEHLLIRIDERLDFAKLVAPLEQRYCRDHGRPAIHPEVMVRALLVCSLYNIASFRRLCSAISESIVFRWFCFLTIDDPVFDHSTISYFIERVGRDGFAGIFHGLNQELLRLGLLSPEMYADSSLVRANVSSHRLASSGLTVAEFQEQAVEENGLFALAGASVDEDGTGQTEVRFFQDPKGTLPLSSVDTDARWRTNRPERPGYLSYQENIVVDRGGFIVARAIAHSSGAEWKALLPMLEEAPIQPVSLTADTGYSAGQLRRDLEERGIKAYIPLHPNQNSGKVARGEFAYHGDHLICSQDKVLRLGPYRSRFQSYKYQALQADCQGCPVKAQCLPPKEKRRQVVLSIYYPEFLRAGERNKSEDYRREMNRRKTVAEGTFASLDRLGWAKSRLRGLAKVDCEGFMAAIAHNVLKLVRRLSRCVGPPDPAMPTATETTVTGSTRDDAVPDYRVVPKYRLRKCLKSVWETGRRCR